MASMKSEPSLVTGAITGLVIAVLAVVTAFGVHLTADQTAAIVGIPAAVAALVQAWLVRRKVTPVSDLLEGH